MMGLLREDAVKELPGTTVSFSFRTRPPTYYFTFGQQRILELALRGDSDADIANELDISKDAVKQTWRAIYERVDSSSGLGADFGVDNPSNHKRRKLLLDYLRTHPEELRPVKKPRPI
jgi:DNA-binding NarL/FixJ family response regulator